MVGVTVPHNGKAVSPSPPLPMPLAAHLATRYKTLRECCGLCRSEGWPGHCIPHPRSGVALSASNSPSERAGKWFKEQNQHGVSPRLALQHSTTSALLPPLLAAYPPRAAGTGMGVLGASWAASGKEFFVGSGVRLCFSREEVMVTQ